MARYSYSGNKKDKKKQNHASEYLPYIINDLSDEIEIVEQVLSGGEEGQVLTADSAGKAKWSAPVGGSGGGVIYDRIEETHEWDSDEGAYKINLTLTLNGESINEDCFVMYKTANTQLDFSDSDFHLGDYTETRKFVYTSNPGGASMDLYVKFYLPSGATMVFLIHEAEGGIA